PTASAAAGPIHIIFSDSAKPSRRVFSTSLDGFQRSRRRFEISIRHKVRRMAPRLNQASNGRHAIVSGMGENVRLMATTTCRRCANDGSSAGRLDTSGKEITNAGTNRIDSTQRVHAIGDAESNQPIGNRMKTAAGTRLRRKLSSNLLRESIESGLRS